MAVAYSVGFASEPNLCEEVLHSKDIIRCIDTVTAIYHTTYGFLTYDFYHMVTSKYMKTKKYWAKTPSKKVYWDLMSKQVEVLSFIETSAKERSYSNIAFFEDTILECYFVAQDNTTRLPDFARSFKISDVAYTEISCLPFP